MNRVWYRSVCFHVPAVVLLAAAAPWRASAQDPKDDTKNFVVMLNPTAGEATSNGAGIIFGVGNGRLYIVTANHVVRPDGQPARVKVYLKWLPGKAVQAELLDTVNRELDLAVLSVPASFGTPPTSWKVLARPGTVSTGSRVFPVGNPRGDMWYCPVQGHVVHTAGSTRIWTEDPLGEGNSGGALLSADGGLVGLMKKTDGDTGESIPIAVVIDEVRRWNYPVQLQDKETGMAPLPGRVLKPAADFKGGSRSVYLAEFNQWPSNNTPQGSVGTEYGTYVLRPIGNAWVGPGRPIDIPVVNGDFLVDVSFRVEGPMPALLSFQLSSAGGVADYLEAFLELWEKNKATYSLQKGKINANFYVNLEQTIAERQPLPAELAAHDWARGGKITLKREGGRMDFFVNGVHITGFPVSLFPVNRIALGAAFPTRIVVTSIEARKP